MRTFRVKVRGRAKTLKVDNDVGRTIDRLRGLGARLSYQGAERHDYPVLVLRVHRLPLNGAGLTLDVDHIDRNRWNAQRDNLRSATRSENAVNTGPKKRAGWRGSSKYKGVSYHGQTDRYAARLTKDGITMYLGIFKTQREAGLVVDQAVRDCFGEYGRYNFPRKGERSALK